MKEILIEQFASVLIPVLLSFIGFIFWKVFQWLKTTVDNDAFQSALKVIEEVTSSVVMELSETVVKQKRLDNGKLLAGAAKEVKEEAVGRIKKLLSGKVQQVAKKSIENIEDFIRGKIEQAVKEQKGKPIRAST